MKIYRTNKGIVIDNENNFYLIQQDWDKFINNDELLKTVPVYALENVKKVNFLLSLLTSFNYMIWGDV